MASTPAHPRPPKRGYLFQKDTVIVTLLVMTIVYVLRMASCFNAHALDPTHTATEDLDFNDLAYTRKESEGHGEEILHMVPGAANITLVNAADTDRAGIAWLIARILDEQPKALGVDLYFDPQRDPQPAVDSALARLFATHDNLVLSYKLEQDSAKTPWQRKGLFVPVARHAGYINFISKGPPGVVRSFTPFEDVREPAVDTSFAAAVWHIAEPDRFAAFFDGKAEAKPAYINYRYIDREFTIIRLDEMVQGNYDSVALRGRIVLLGQLGRHADDVEDMQFTPLNPRFAGKSLPDMHGTVIHANILNMWRTNAAVRHIPGWVNFVLCTVLVWLFLAFYLRFYVEYHHWFHLAARAAQILFAILAVWLSIELLSRWRIRLDITEMLVAIALTVDVLYFYEFIARRRQKSGRRSWFDNEKH